MTKILKNNLKHKVLKNVFYNFLTTLISRIGALIFTIIVARFLFPELFGIYNLALTIILTIATFTDLGLNTTLIRYLAESLKKKKAEKEARARVAFLFNFKIFLTAIIAFLLFFFAKQIAIYIFNKSSLVLPLQIGAIYLFVISLQGFLTSIFFAVQKVKYNALAEIIFQVSRIALVLIFFSFYKNVESVFIALSIAISISCAFLFSILSLKYRFLIKGEKQELSAEEKKRLLGFFSWLTISSISLVFFVHVDTFMLGIFLPAEFVGFYHAIFAIVGSVASFVAFGSVLLPVFTQLEEGRLEKGFKKVFHYTALIAIPAAVGLICVIVPAIRIIYGQAYTPAQYNLAIKITSALLSLLVIESAFSPAYAALFQAKEKPKIPAILIVIATIANIILNYAFIKAGLLIAPQYGMVAVAFATLLVRYGNMASLAVLARKKLKIKANIASIAKPLLASAIMLAFLFAFDYFINLNILTGILMIIAAVLVYFFALWIIKGVSKEDFELIRRF